MPTDETRAPLAEEHAAGGTALLIIDMLSDWGFQQGEELLDKALPMAAAIEALAARCRRLGVPVVYINDNRGRWQSDFPAVVRHARDQAGPGGDIARKLAPQDADYCVLKPKHSGFYATPLELLLRHLHVGQVILTGVSAEHCVAMTAADARMRDFEVWCPQDAVASHSSALLERTLCQLRETLHVRTEPSTQLRLPALGNDA